MAIGSSLNITIFVRYFAGEYSGGRYYSWIMAEGLAHAGHRVKCITNHRPIFYHDFSEYPRHGTIEFDIVKGFKPSRSNFPADVVILIPEMSNDLSIYRQALKHSIENNARLVLLNFESPNWFNSLASTARDPARWDSWAKIGEQADLILSMAEEANIYAKEFYHPPSGSRAFAYCYPCINNIVADMVENPPETDMRDKRILIIARFINASHKGSEHIERIIDNGTANCTLVLLVGQGQIPEILLTSIKAKALSHNIKIEVKHRLTDLEKFYEIKRSRLMLFPSEFEGFGLPPLEALYCGIPCIVFDLPVLREIGGGSLIYAPRGNWDILKAYLNKNIKLQQRYSPQIRDSIYSIASFTCYSERIDKIIQETMSRVPVRKKAFPGRWNLFRSR